MIFFFSKPVELTETQTFDNAQLKREKAEIENDLLKTQVSINRFE